MKNNMSGGIQQIMRQANQMQTRMQKVQEEFAERQFEGSAGGGAVKVKVKNHMLLEVNIQDDLMKENDKEMLQDLIVSAANDAIKTAKAQLQQEMDQVTGGIKLPGM